MKNSPEEFQDREEFQDCDEDPEHNPTAAPRGIVSSGMQIFIKVLTGQSIPIDVKDSDTVETTKDKFINNLDWLLRGFDVEDFLEKEKELWTSGRFQLSYGGKQLDDDKTLADYNIQKGATVNMVYGLDGGGKRGNAGEAMQSNSTKDTVTEDLMDNIGKLERLIGDVTGNPHLLALLNRSKHHVEIAHTGEVLVRALNRDRLKRLKDGLDTTNVEQKAIAVKTHLFAEEASTTKSFKSIIQSLEELLTTVSKLICVQSFSNTKGEIQWWQLKNIIEDQVSILDREAGAQAAAAMQVG